MTLPEGPVGPLSVERYGPACAVSPWERGTDGPRLILVGIDGSETSMRATAYACGMARRQHSQLAVVYVAEPNAWTSLITGAAAAQQRTFDELETELRREVRQLAEEMRVPVTFLTRRGDPYGELRAAADDLKADAVIVGASVQPGHRLVGSVAARLVRTGKWPVAVVP
ncbi:universal stress protein [Hamadaea sp. NPDC050747]|uniref:universal stress protein n=1 Tax=Hamadaea sp. NPDC050747 TaxID=3155789 RepID=UPI0033FF3406